MTPSRAAVIVRCAVVVTLGGCGAREDVPGNVTVGSPAPAVTPDSATAGAGCRLSGLWESCAVEDRMTHAGLVWEKQATPAAYPFLALPGTTYRVGADEDEVHVFLYPSAEARRADTDRLDSLAVSPKGERRGYKVMPLLVTSNNLTALVFTRNERTQERIALALSAGLPQPK